jgi:hypothetical protein
MLVNIGLVIGGLKDQSLIVVYAIKNAPSAIFSALRDALNATPRDILKPTCFIARGVAFALPNAEEKQ